MRKLFSVPLLCLLAAANTTFAFAMDAASSNAPKKAKAVIASYNPEARSAAKEVLESGGNAFDAFVTATLVEYVVAPGVTSLAGPLTALTFNKQKNETLYLDAEMNHVADPNGIWKEGEPSGKGVMVPGALRGLEELHRRNGKLLWSRLVQPAINLAKNGFEIDWAYSAIVAYRAEVLKSSAYGARTFFKNSKPLQPGDRLVQPELARFLKQVALRGSRALYSGQWAESFVATVRKQGGLMQESELKSYRAKWLAPRHIQYRGFDVYGSSGRSFGGAWSLLALKTLENFNIGRGPHFSTSSDQLEVMVRVARNLWNETWLFQTENLDDEKKAAQLLSSVHALSVWERVLKELPTLAPERRGSHSYHVVIVDQDGNAVTGTNTINSLPWGDGVFVEGIPLTNSISHLGNATRPGERRLTPMSSHLVFKDGQLKVVSGTFNSSLIEAGFQLLVNSLDFNLPAEKAAHLPRFGTFSFDDHDTGSIKGKNWLDPAIPKEIVEDLRMRGLEFEQQGQFIDTGSGAIAILDEDGSVEAGLLPLTGHDGQPTYLYQRI